MHRYRFALRPSWIVRHVLVVVLVVVMVNLGFWQLRRLDERKDANALVETRMAEPEAPVAEVLDHDASVADAEDAVYRRVRASGTYDVDDQVIVRARSLDGRPGAWVLTPLVTAPDVGLVVNRGWFPTQGVPHTAPAETAPPAGEVTVTGLLSPTQRRGRFGPTDPRTGTLTDLARADIDRIQQQVELDLYPAYVTLVSQVPAQAGDLPRPLPSPVLDDGPHLSYAVQWFTFSTIAVVGYPIILRRAARPRAG